MTKNLKLDIMLKLLTHFQMVKKSQKNQKSETAKKGKKASNTWMDRHRNHAEAAVVKQEAIYVSYLWIIA